MRKAKRIAAATPPVGLETTVSAKDRYSDDDDIQVDKEAPSPRDMLRKYLDNG